MIKIAIIEDEYAGQQLIKGILTNNFPNCEIVAICETVSMGVQCIKKYQPDLVLIDVELKDGTGFDLLTNFEYNRLFEIIFVTAYSKYALNAIKEMALDYILKPINISEFIKGIEKAIKKISTKNSVTNASLISVNTQTGYEIVAVNDIVFLEAERAHTHIYTSSQQILSSKNIGEYAEILPLKQFFRTHHSFIVNLSSIKSVKKGRGGMVLLKSGHSIPISQRRIKYFLELFDNKSIIYN